MEIENGNINTEQPSKDVIFNLMSKFENSKQELKPRILENNIKYNDQFILPQNKEFDKQYSHIYFLRLSVLGPILRAKVIDYCGVDPINNIVSVPHSQQCVIIGTIYKDMKLKPSVLNGTEEKTFQKQNANYTSDTDTISLEDQYGRIKLKLKNDSYYVNLQGEKEPLSIQNLVTGLVVAIEGVMDKDTGVFHIIQIIFNGLQEQDKSSFQIEKPLLQNKNHNFNDLKHYLSENNTDKFVMFVSGLNQNQDDSNFSMMMLKNFLFGATSSPSLKALSQRIIKLVIAGNTICPPSDMEEVLEGSYKVDADFDKMYKHITNSMKAVDQYVSELINFIPVDIMPGEQDPSNRLYPQQPLNKCYFQKSYQNARLNCISNPCSFSLSDIEFVGTSGQNVQNIKKYTNFSENDIEIVENNILWGHIAPTAPDTLNCYPFYLKEDIFVLEQIPHVYFVGNCDRFGTKMIYEPGDNKFCRIIAIPVFSESKSAVIMNLRNLDTFELKFDAPL